MDYIQSGKVESGEFLEAIKDIRIPILVLDEKWHHLFKGIGKTDEILEREKEVDALLKLQGKLNDDLRALKKIKNDLMQGIVDNMDAVDSANSDSSRRQKIEENKRLIDEVNEKMNECEDRLLELPRELDMANKNLMIYSMDYCYRKLRENSKEIEEIGRWISEIRVELKKKILIKQNDEHKNEEIYSYMHDILGAVVIDVFDLQYDNDKDTDINE